MPRIEQNTSKSRHNNLVVSLASSMEEVKAAQSLRFRVFAEEMGAQLPNSDGRLDRDHFDTYCHHLIVRDTTTGEVVAYTRILTNAQAKLAGRYYSESEFDLHHIHSLSGKIMEVGRTCVHQDYRSGGAIGVLWSGLAQFMVENQFDYLMGCASIPITNDGLSIRMLYEHLKHKYLSHEETRVYPKTAMPIHLFSLQEHVDIDWQKPMPLPPLLKAYMRLGAEVCGEPCWDPDFSVADVFVLLDRRRLNARYAKHFVQRTVQECKPVDNFIAVTPPGMLAA